MYLPGDVAKAFARGADFVMLGGMLAGHDEGGGKVVTKHIATGGHTKHQKEHLFLILKNRILFSFMA